MSKASQVLLATLKETFPAAFPSEPKAIRPLKIGIHEDLKAALSDVDPKLLRHALAHHTQRPAYLLALARGGDRIDLEGKAVEPVTAEARQHADDCLEEIKASQKAKKATQKAAEVPKAPKQETSPGKAKKAAPGPRGTPEANRQTEKGKPVEASSKPQTPEIPKKSRPVLSLKRRPT